jgi:hypothetical protein
MNVVRMVLLGCCALAGPACDDSPELTFRFSEAGHGTVITPSVDATSLAQSVIVFVGQLNTPRPCYRLTGDLDVEGSEVTLTVNARENSAPNCESIVGRFTYEGEIRRLNAGTYQTRFRHVFDRPDWPDQQFDFSIVVR